MIPLFDTRLSLGERLRRARRHAELSQQELADELGVSKFSVINYEADARMPKFDLVILWSLTTGVPLSYFAEAGVEESILDQFTATTWSNLAGLEEEHIYRQSSLPFPIATTAA